MEITENRLKRLLKDPKECQRRYGAPMAKKIRLRVDALEAAESLDDFWPPYSGPERCHELKGNLAGTYSMDVKQPHRILFKSNDPVTETVETKKEVASEKTGDEKQRWMAIRSIELTSIADTHG
ncbi:MAG: type II toxin-antitoxin system RelE/ParE family toxin [Nitrososphaera sp.]|nr:type II toxin-antitoxin system RelE/ParE family toxin [Nitrososphaera sp.]